MKVFERNLMAVGNAISNGVSGLLIDTKINFGYCKGLNLCIFYKNPIQIHGEEEDGTLTKTQIESISNNYTRAAYVTETEGLYKGYKVGLGQGVKSDGSIKRLGHFLFYLQLLLSIGCGVYDFHLDNYTDHPDKVANGIYSMLLI